MCYVKYYIFSISLRFSCDIITTERVRNGKNIVKFLIHCPQENIIFQNFILQTASDTCCAFERTLSLVEARQRKNEGGVSERQKLRELCELSELAE